MDRGLDAHLTLEPGPDQGDRERQNTKYFKRADGVMVYFGESDDDLWLATTCDLVRDNMRPDGHRVVVVAPPLDKPRVKARLREPEFECCRVASSDDITFIEGWLQALAGGAAKPASAGS